MTARLGEFVEAHGRAMVLIILTFAFAGVVFLFGLPTSIFPQTDFPRVVILGQQWNRSGIQTLTITRPIEEAVRLVPGITNIRSVTSRVQKNGILMLNSEQYFSEQVTNCAKRSSMPGGAGCDQF